MNVLHILSANGGEWVAGRHGKQWCMHVAKPSWIQHLCMCRETLLLTIDSCRRRFRSFGQSRLMRSHSRCTANVHKLITMLRCQQTKARLSQWYQSLVPSRRDATILVNSTPRQHLGNSPAVVQTWHASQVSVVQSSRKQETLTRPRSSLPAHGALL